VPNPLDPHTSEKEPSVPYRVVMIGAGPANGHRPTPARQGDGQARQR
jgi:hypothetical protein